MKLKCPRCKKEIEYSVDNPHRPFCSDRCRNIDFGLWIEEQYAVAGETVDLNVASESNKTEDGNEDPLH